MSTSWVVQTNVEATSPTPDLLRRACAALHLSFYEISVTPRSPALPVMPEIDDPVVLHGRTTLILRACEDTRWRRGIFFDPATFQHRAYVAHYGDEMLNADAHIVTWSQFLTSTRSPDSAYFVKPNDDLKQFTGGVYRFADCLFLFKRLTANSPLTTQETEIVVGTPREVDAEWRLFVVAGKVISGSMYRPSGDGYLPPELIAFGETAAARWTPAPVFALDVARSEGKYKIVECNCFNGSRFYNSDVERVVHAVSRYQENWVGQ